MNKTMLAILKVLEDYPEGVLGSREISRKLKGHGLDLTERTVRYHMRILDERGYTNCMGKKGRAITGKGSEELCKAQVSAKLGFIISRIETLSYQTDVDLAARSGRAILNFSFFPEERLKEALDIMRPIFESRFCVSRRVLLLRPGDQLGSIRVPAGMVGFGTMCSITINGIFLKAGIPVTSRFGGVMEVEEEKPRRFTALISYAGTSLDPMEIFIKGRMTSVSKAVKDGGGSVLGSFREIPAAALDSARSLDAAMKQAGIEGILTVGKPNSDLFEVPVGADRVGMVVVGGLNPVAALEESGIPTISAAMSTLHDFGGLVRFDSLL